MNLMNTIVSATIAAVVTLPTYAQTIDQSHSIRPFDELELSGCFDATLVPGTTNQVKITATAHQQKMLRITQKGDELKIKATQNDLCSDGPVKVAITTSFAPTAKVELSLRGSGAIAVDVATVRSLDVSLKGSGHATVKGKTKSCDLDIAGSGNIDAPDLACDSADVEIKGSGNVKVASARELGVEIKGSGHVLYAGQPKLKKVEIKGSGKLERL